MYLLIVMLTFEYLGTHILLWTSCLKRCPLSSNTLGKTELIRCLNTFTSALLNCKDLSQFCPFDSVPCRLRSVIGLGVGAGAYILAKFAVSPNTYLKEKKEK